MFNFSQTYINAIAYLDLENVIKIQWLSNFLRNFNFPEWFVTTIYPFLLLWVLIVVIDLSYMIVNKIYVH
jgi:hypothetical protein